MNDEQQSEFFSLPTESNITNPQFITINSATTRDDGNGSNSKKAWQQVKYKYKECMKNHAASMGGNATDGCGEFLPNGRHGTLEALMCSACNCHRNFHKKELLQEAPRFIFPSTLPSNCNFLVSPSSIVQAPKKNKKRRFRTKFTEEQKEKLVRFGERAGWEMAKVEDSVVQSFCEEIGIRRKVLKVWMHNNKHTFSN